MVGNPYLGRGHVWIISSLTLVAEVAGKPKLGIKSPNLHGAQGTTVQRLV